jgi:hypothetical protein
MIDPLVTLAVSGLALATALFIISRLVPDEYDYRVVAARRSETTPEA